MLSILYSGLAKVYIFLSFSRHFFLSSPLLVLKQCRLGLALMMKTCCLSGEEQSKIIGMHKVGAKRVEIVVKLVHPNSSLRVVMHAFVTDQS